MVLEIKDLIKNYYHKEKKIEVLKSLSYNFEKGKFYGIMGHSGSGKTTLFNIIGTIDKEYNGNILVNSKNISSLNDEDMASLRNLEIGFVFQDFFLDEGLTALENVMVPMIINANIPKEEREVIAKKLLKEVGMEDREKHFPKELSGGEKQRVAIARALSNNPNILLCDEPTGNLDEETENKIFALLKNLSKSGKCVIVVSHSNEVKSYADVMLYLKDGKLNEIAD
jgi:ABC transporter, ATP-binding protein